MESSVCLSCLKPKANLKCGICNGHVCKRCAQFVEEGSLSFLEEIPEALNHGSYCAPCFDDKISQELSDYQAAMDRAREVFVFHKKQSKETRLMKRTEPPLKVTDCADKDEALLRLAFSAAQANFNTLIDVVISSQKVREGAYQTTVWHGVGIPVFMDPDKMNRWNSPTQSNTSVSKG